MKKWTSYMLRMKVLIFKLLDNLKELIIEWGLELAQGWVDLVQFNHKIQIH